MKRFVSLCLIILLAICAFASCADNAPGVTNAPEVSATPEISAIPQVSPTPQATATPGIFATAEEAYLENISSVLEILDSIKENHSADYYEDYFRGALEDLDNDGQCELILVYDCVDTLSCYYKIYTFQSGSSVLLKEGELFVAAGAPRGGISLVNYNNEQYISIWNYNSHVEEYTKMTYHCELFIMENSALVSKHTFDFSYYLNNGPMDENSTLLRDDESIPFEEFQLIKYDFDNATKVLCNAGSMNYAGYRLRQLYENLKNK